MSARSASTSGAANLPYAVENISVESHTTESPVTTQPWRSVDNTHTAYVVETFIDELAHAAGKDAVAFRQGMLADKPRYAAAVLALAAEKGGWGEKLGPGKGRGIALHNTFGTTVVASGRRDGGTSMAILKSTAWSARWICGMAVNPDVIKAQMEGGVAFGLGSILYSAITLKNGHVEQTNFNDYRVLRISEMPTVETYIVPSAAPPNGIGEPPVPPIGPAVANAVFAATGKRLRVLPLMKV